MPSETGLSGAAGAGGGGGGGGDASAANQVLGLTALDQIYDALVLVGTEATSADILAAVNSLGDGATLADLATALAPLATEATQQDVLAALEAQAIDVGLIQTNVALLVPDVDAMKDSLASIDGKIPVQGQALAAASMPVVLPVSQAAGALALQSQLPVALGSGGGIKVDGSGTALPVSGPLTDVELRATAVPVSAASLPLPTNAATENKQDTGNSSLSSIDGKIPANLTVASTRLLVDPSGVTSPVSAASLPLPTGAATAAKQPALGTAGSPSADVISVQGVGGGTPIPISGTVTSTPSGTQTITGTVDTELPTAAALSDSMGLAPTVPAVGAYAIAIDGTVARRVRCSTIGNLFVEGPGASAAAVTGRPVRIAGSDGGNTRDILTDTSGRVVVLQTAADSGGTARTVSSTFGGSQIVAFDAANLGPFGDLIAEDKTPVLTRHWTILNAFDPQQDETVTQANGATVSVTTQRLTLTSGTTNAADACYRTIKCAQYRPGQGFIFRWTAAFTTGVASSTQEIGFGNGANGGGGNAIAVGYNGTAFGILHRNAGSSTWTAQASWNGDKCNGTGASGFRLDPTKGNVYMAAVPYLGYGDIQIFIQESTTGRFVLAHTIRYTNSSATPEFSDPAFRFYGRVVSTGSTTNLVAYSASASAFVVGKVGDDGQQWAENRTLSVNGTAAVLSIRNATTVNSALNNTPIRIRSISFTADNGNTTSTGIAAYGVTLGGTPAFSALTGLSATTADNGATLTSATTIGTVDIAGTTVTGGNPIWNTATSRNNVSSSGELEKNPIYIWPGQTMTFYATTGTAANVTFAINGTIG